MSRSRCPQRCYSILSRNIFLPKKKNRRTYFFERTLTSPAPKIPSVPTPTNPKTLLSSNFWGMSWKKPDGCFEILVLKCFSVLVPFYENASKEGVIKCFEITSSCSFGHTALLFIINVNKLLAPTYQVIAFRSCKLEVVVKLGNRNQSHILRKLIEIACISVTKHWKVPTVDSKTLKMHHFKLKLKFLTCFNLIAVNDVEIFSSCAVKMQKCLSFVQTQFTLLLLLGM